VLEGALEDVGDDLHVLVGVEREAVATLDASSLMTRRKRRTCSPGRSSRRREGVEGVEPAVVEVPRSATSADSDHERSP